MFCSTMNRNTVRSAQTVCASSACVENTAIMIMDAITASIFALISICIRLLAPHAVRNLATDPLIAYSA